MLIKECTNYMILKMQKTWHKRHKKANYHQRFWMKQPTSWQHVFWIEWRQEDAILRRDIFDAVFWSWLHHIISRLCWMNGSSRWKKLLQYLLLLHMSICKGNVPSYSRILPKFSWNYSNMHSSLPLKVNKPSSFQNHDTCHMFFFWFVKDTCHMLYPVHLLCIKTVDFKPHVSHLSKK